MPVSEGSKEFEIVSFSYVGTVFKEWVIFKIKF